MRDIQAHIPGWFPARRAIFERPLLVSAAARVFRTIANSGGRVWRIRCALSPRSLPSRCSRCSAPAKLPRLRRGPSATPGPSDAGTQAGACAFSGTPALAGNACWSWASSSAANEPIAPGARDSIEVYSDDATASVSSSDPTIAAFTLEGPADPGDGSVAFSALPTGPGASEVDTFIVSEPGDYTATCFAGAQQASVSFSAP